MYNFDDIKTKKIVTCILIFDPQQMLIMEQIASK